MRLLPALVLLAACAVPVEDLPEDLATAVCDKAEECDDLDSSHANCVSLWTGLVNVWIDVAEAQNYAYDAGAGGACVRAVRGLSCDDNEEFDFDAECGDVWR